MHRPAKPTIGAVVVQLEIKGQENTGLYFQIDLTTIDAAVSGATPRMRQLFGSGFAGGCI
jgi:hypothetical protein